MKNDILAIKEMNWANWTTEASRITCIQESLNTEKLKQLVEICERIGADIHLVPEGWTCDYIQIIISKPEKRIRD